MLYIYEDTYKADSETRLVLLLMDIILYIIKIYIYNYYICTNRLNINDQQIRRLVYTIKRLFYNEHSVLH